MEPLNLLLFLFAQLKRHNIMVTSNSTWMQMDTESGVDVNIDTLCKCTLFRQHKFLSNHCHVKVLKCMTMIVMLSALETVIGRSIHFLYSIIVTKLPILCNVTSFMLYQLMLTNMCPQSIMILNTKCNKLFIFINLFFYFAL